MSWLPLGSIKPDLFWRSFSVPGLNNTVIRVTHSFNRMPSAYALLKFDLTEGYFGTSRLYPYSNQRLITVTIPPALFESGEVVWYPSVKLGRFRRVVEPDNWTINLEQWSEPATPDSTLSQRLDELLADAERIEAKLDQQATNNPAFADQLPNVDELP